MIKQIDHIGIAVKSTEECLKLYRDLLGLKIADAEKVESQGINVTIIPVGEVNLELLEPFTSDSPVAKFIEKHGEGIHHIAFRVDSIMGQLEKSKSLGMKVVHEVPFRGAHGKLAAFLHPKSTFGVLTEFNEIDEKKE